MTIEEYLSSESEYAKKMMIGNYDTEELNFYEGYIEAMSAVLEQLPKLDHDVTLREVKEECQKHGDEGGCYGCVLLRRPSCAVPYYCGVGGMPSGWDIDAIQKRMKEAHRD